ncbi:LacI family DNA-binding transcriptional regulator [Kribbella speibonae]|uniref:LacI family transcriptional regulator n=1 Tax=Kribbella speibonae TaxID=1572660 RepID=A0A4R0IV33_9ACTN|nr:LacI family DNA-binding transcriptional regulator [Kribbella speibonae]TCC36404.1 LacI family transcriptional regulator [Kribbella speibonae]
MKAATIYDVAREAGVSHQTVTRYLQGYEGMRPATRQRVEAALERLQYRPNTAARQLRLRRSNRIAVLADRLGQGGPALIVQGVTEMLQKRGFVGDILAVNGEDPASVDAAIDLATEYQVAGILATAQTNVVLERLRHRTLAVPMVIDAQIVDPASGVLIGELVGRRVAEHLLELGHRRIGYVSGPDGWFAARDRAAGFIAAVEAAGRDVVWVREGDWSADSGYRAWQGLKAKEQTVTAVAAANDAMAIGVIAAALDDGRAVPEELSVIGTDDLDEGRFMRPALTTVQMDFVGEGARLAAQLIDRISPAEAETSSTADEPYSPNLIVRSSTARIAQRSRSTRRTS